MKKRVEITRVQRSLVFGSRLGKAEIWGGGGSVPQAVKQKLPGMMKRWDPCLSIPESCVQQVAGGRWQVPK